MSTNETRFAAKEAQAFRHEEQLLLLRQLKLRESLARPCCVQDFQAAPSDYAGTSGVGTSRLPSLRKAKYQD